MVENFLNYDRITDTIMYFNRYITLNFCVNLTRKGKNGNMSFHSEYEFYSENYERESHTIKRMIDSYFLINDSRDFNNSIIIKAQDILMLRFLLSDQLLPWFVGKHRVFGFDNNNRLILKGKWKQQEFPLSEYKYIGFAPIILEYDDGTLKEGIRFIFNSSDNYVDIDVNKFFEFYHYIMDTNMYTTAAILLNYVKMIPYGCNMTDLRNKNEKKGFFDQN